MVAMVNINEIQKVLFKGIMILYCAAQSIDQFRLCVISVISRFVIKGGLWVLIALVHDHYILVTF